MTETARNRRRRLAIASALVAAILYPPAAAVAEETGDKLRGSLTLYGWIPWFDGRVKTGAGSASTSIDASHVLDALDFAMMGTGRIEYGRFGFTVDAVYSKFSTTGTILGQLPSGAKISSKMLLVTNALSYRFFEHDGAAAEALAGARVVYTEFGVRPLGTVDTASASDTWVDPVIGLRGRLPLTDKLTAFGLADVGGFGTGSQFTWEVVAGLDYALTESISAKAAFRYLSIDYSKNGGDFDLDVFGPALGLTVSF